VNKTVVVVAKIKAQPGKSVELRRELQELVRATHLEPGVLLYELSQSSADSDDFLVYEKYGSQEAFDAHLAGPALQHFLTLAPGLVQGEVEIKPYTPVPATD
jgi:quinol monooxygenase YgiN